MPLYDWQSRPIPGIGVVYVDDMPVQHCAAAHTDEGWADVFETDAAGQFVLVTRDGERELNVLRIYGEVRVEFQTPASPSRSETLKNEYDAECSRRGIRPLSKAGRALLNQMGAAAAKGACAT